MVGVHDSPQCARPSKGYQYGPLYSSAAISTLPCGLCLWTRAVCAPTQGTVMVHYSRNTPQKQWDETNVLVIDGLARVIRSGHFVTRRRSSSSPSDVSMF